MGRRYKKLLFKEQDSFFGTPAKVAGPENETTTPARDTGQSIPASLQRRFVDSTNTAPTGPLGRPDLRQQIFRQLQENYGNRYVTRLATRRATINLPQTEQGGPVTPSVFNGNGIMPVQRAIPVGRAAAPNIIQRKGTRKKGKLSGFTAGKEDASKDIETTLDANDDERTAALITAISDAKQKQQKSNQNRLRIRPKKTSIEVFNELTLQLNGSPLLTEYNKNGRDLRNDLTALFPTTFGTYTVSYLMDLATHGFPSLKSQLMLMLGTVSVTKIADGEEVIRLTHKFQTEWGKLATQDAPPKPADKAWIQAANFIDPAHPDLKAALVKAQTQGFLTVKRLYALGQYQKAHQDAVANPTDANKKLKQNQKQDAYLHALMKEYMVWVKRKTRGGTIVNKYTAFDYRGFVEELKTWGRHATIEEREWIVPDMNTRNGTANTNNSKTVAQLQELGGSGRGTNLRKLLPEKIYKFILDVISNPEAAGNMPDPNSEDVSSQEELGETDYGRGKDIDYGSAMKLQALINKTTESAKLKGHTKAKGTTMKKQRHALKLIAQINSMNDIATQQFIAIRFTNGVDRTKYLDPVTSADEKKTLFNTIKPQLETDLRIAGLDKLQRAAMLAKLEYGLGVGSTYQRLKELVADGKVRIGKFSDRALELVAQLEGAEFAQVRRDKEMIKAMWELSGDGTEKDWEKIARLLRVRVENGNVQYRTAERDSQGQAEYKDEFGENTQTGAQTSELHRDEIEMRPKYWAWMLHREISNTFVNESYVAQLAARAVLVGKKREELLASGKTGVRFKNQDTTHATNTQAGFLKKIDHYLTTNHPKSKKWLNTKMRDVHDALVNGTAVNSEIVLKYSKSGIAVIGGKESKSGIRAAFTDLNGKELLEQWSNIAEFRQAKTDYLAAPAGQAKDDLGRQLGKFLLDVSPDKRTWLQQNTKMGIKDRLLMLNEVRTKLRNSARKDTEVRKELEETFKDTPLEGSANEFYFEQLKARDLLDVEVMKETGFQGGKLDKDVQISNQGMKETRGMLIGATRRGRRAIKDAPTPDKEQVSGEHSRKVRTLNEELGIRQEAFSSKREAFLASVTRVVTTVLGVIISIALGAIPGMPPQLVGIIKAAVTGIVEEALKKLILGDEFGSLRESVINVIMKTAAAALTSLLNQGGIFGDDSLMDQFKDVMKTGIYEAPIDPLTGKEITESYLQAPLQFSDLGGEAVASLTEGGAKTILEKGGRSLIDRDPDQFHEMLRNKVFYVKEGLKAFLNRSAIEFILSGTVGDVAKQTIAETNNFIKEGLENMPQLGDLMGLPNLDHLAGVFSQEFSNIKTRAETLTHEVFSSIGTLKIPDTGGLTKTLREGTREIGKGIDKGFHFVMDGIGGVNLPDLSGISRQIGSGLTSVSTSFNSGMHQVGQDIGQVNMPDGSPIGQQIKSGLVTVHNDMDQQMQHLGTVIGGLHLPNVPGGNGSNVPGLSQVETVVLTGTQKIVDGINGGFGGLATLISSSSAPDLSSIGDQITQGITDLRNMINQGFSDLARQIQGIQLPDMGGDTNSVSQDIHDFTGDTNQGIHDFARLGHGFTVGDTGVIGQGIGEGISTVSQGINHGIQDISQWGQNVQLPDLSNEAGALGEAINSVKNGVVDGMNWVSTQVNELGNSMDEFQIDDNSDEVPAQQEFINDQIDMLLETGTESLVVMGETLSPWRLIELTKENRGAGIIGLKHRERKAMSGKAPDLIVKIRAAIAASGTKKTALETAMQDLKDTETRAQTAKGNVVGATDLTDIDNKLKAVTDEAENAEKVDHPAIAAAYNEAQGEINKAQLNLTTLEEVDPTNAEIANLQTELQNAKDDIAHVYKPDEIKDALVSCHKAIEESKAAIYLLKIKVLGDKAATDFDQGAFDTQAAKLFTARTDLETLRDNARAIANKDWKALTDGDINGIGQHLTDAEMHGTSSKTDLDDLVARLNPAPNSGLKSFKAAYTEALAVVAEARQNKEKVNALPKVDSTVKAVADQALTDAEAKAEDLNPDKALTSNSALQALKDAKEKHKDAEIAWVELNMLAEGVREYKKRAEYKKRLVAFDGRLTTLAGEAATLLTNTRTARNKARQNWRVAERTPENQPDALKDAINKAVAGFDEASQHYNDYNGKIKEFQRIYKDALKIQTEATTNQSTVTSGINTRATELAGQVENAGARTAADTGKGDVTRSADFTLTHITGLVKGFNPDADPADLHAKIEEVVSNRATVETLKNEAEDFKNRATRIGVQKSTNIITKAKYLVK